MKILFILLLTFKLTVCSEKLFICYYTNWSQYRAEGGKFFPENIDPFLCTHIIFAFAKLERDQLLSYEWNDEDSEWSKGLYHRTVQLKQQNPDLKVLIGVGGWNHGPEAFSKMVHSSYLRKSFVKQAVSFLKKHKFDGLDLDWEYPGSRNGSQPTDKQHFTTLLKELKAAFKPYHYLITVGVAAGKSNIDNGYEIQNIAQYVDYTLLMAYDLHGPWASQIDHNSPLYGRRNLQDNLNTDWAVKYWINSGMPREKLVLGLATYGRTFKLQDRNKIIEGSMATGPGEAGIITKEPGFLSYYEICDKLQDGWTTVWNDEQKVPYAYKNDEWVSYENIDSLKIKARYAVENNLSGVMFWTIDYDDFEGNFCNQGKYPLLTACKEELYNSMEELERIKNSQFTTTYSYSNTKQNFDDSNYIQYQQYLNSQNQMASNNIDSLTQNYNSDFTPSLNNYNSLPSNLNEYNNKPVYNNFEPSIPSNSLTEYNDDNTIKKHGNGIISNDKNTYEISKIYEKLAKLETTSTIPTTTSTTSKINLDMNTDISYVCEADGLYVDRTNDCRSFITCLWTKTRNAKKIRFVCPEQTRFSEINKVCDWDWKVPC